MAKNNNHKAVSYNKWGYRFRTVGIPAEEVHLVTLEVGLDPGVERLTPLAGSGTFPDGIRLNPDDHTVGGDQDYVVVQVYHLDSGHIAVLIHVTVSYTHLRG